VDLIGIEPMTSSMPFREAECYRATHNVVAQYGKAVFMRVCRTFAAFRMCLSDTARHNPARVGMAGS
jgi:hypothetical protein